jgi:hypothetical protein
MLRMRVPLTLATVCVLTPSVLLVQRASAQVASATTGDRVIRMTGVLRSADHRQAGPTETVTYSIYSEEGGGTLLWQETQSVAVDAQGQYEILLGAMSRDGLPSDLFAGGQSRWVSVQWQGEPEGPRMLVTAVPYAVKAADADMLGGRPASDYLVAGAAGSGGRSSRSGNAATTSGGTAMASLDLLTAGTPGHIGKFIDTVNLGDSDIFETAGGLVGVGTTTPTDKLFTRFTNTTGTMTGIAVQNLGATATSYSGMLFYDQNGALGQFQGFNNSTHEYRINNIASGGTINFMINGTSGFKVANNGFVGIGNGSPENELHIGAGGNPILKIDGAVNSTGNGPRLRWTETFSSDYGVEAQLDGGIDALIFRNIEGGTPAPDNIFVIKRLLGRVGIGTLNPADTLDVDGDIRVGTGTTGCVKDSDGTVIAGVCSSDLRLKRQITPFQSSLDKVSQLQPVHFYWRQDEFPERGFGASQSFGLIAQDVERVLPELVTTDKDGYRAVKYNELPFHMLQAIKELKAENDELKARLAAIESAVKAMSK